MTKKNIPKLVFLCFLSMHWIHCSSPHQSNSQLPTANHFVPDAEPVSYEYLLPSEPTQFTLTGIISPVGIDDEQRFTVLALDSHGNTASTYKGTIRFSSTDPDAILPSDYQFVESDYGVKTFKGRFLNQGTQTLSVHDISKISVSGKSYLFTVKPKPNLTTAITYDPTQNVIQVRGSLSVSLSDIKATLPTAPLELIDPNAHIWFLKAPLQIGGGARLHLLGSSVGGDVDELRIMSQNTGSVPAIAFIEAKGGRIEINTTKVLSWDDNVSAPDQDYTTHNRAFIRVISTLHSDGTTLMLSRMDIFSSEVSYLGFPYDPQDPSNLGGGVYGLSWRVGGIAGPNYELFDTVDVFGDVTGNNIHDNYFGFYSYGGYGMQILSNHVHDNAIYGIDPHDDSDYLFIRNNIAERNLHHGIIASKRCDHISITHNISQYNGEHGIMLHRLSDFGHIENNQSLYNGDAGIAIFDSSNTMIRNNLTLGNRDAIRFSVGASDNFIVSNLIKNSLNSGFRFFKGSDLPTSGDGHPKRNYFYQNTLENNLQTIQTLNADENIFWKNQFKEGNGPINLFQSFNNQFLLNDIAESILINTY